MEGLVIKELALNELCTVQSQLVLKSREIQKDTVVKGSGQLQPTHILINEFQTLQPSTLLVLFSKQTVNQVRPQTSEPALLWAGTMTGTAPIRSNVA